MAQAQSRDGGHRRAQTGMTVATQWYDPAVTVVTVDGVVDAANVERLIDIVLDRAMLCCSMIVDLRGVRYMSVSGLEALRLLHARCEIADTRWTVIPSPSVQRLLRRFDTVGEVPTTESLEAAFAAAELHVPIVQITHKAGAGRSA